MVSTILKTLLFALFFASYQVEATPHRIIVITPGETSSTNSLTSEGQKRAAGLVGFFLGIPPKTPPLFADIVGKSETPSHPISYVGSPSTLSCIQTISPLANVIFYKKAPISVFTNIPESVEQFLPNKLGPLKETLYETEEHHGKTAIICTKNQDVPTLLINLEPRMRHNSNFQKTFSSEATSNQAFVITYKKDKPRFQVMQIKL
ncbi:hypothetical protein [Simkania sp.]|uniref:hypothetical protein n=1 Tax=Simkania sp. TaxID=34094 RepID=UPI003B51987F